MTKKQIFVYTAVSVVLAPVVATGVAAVTATRHLAKLRVQVAKDKEEIRKRLGQI